jgi:membrane-bound serine protease (ClpP class)
MKRLLQSLFVFISVTVLFGAPVMAQESRDVYIVSIKGPIDNGLASYVDRAVEAAVASKSRGILFHVDTFGGLVDAADRIRKTILDSPIPTVAFIDKNAASAGALISLACDSIFVAPGSSIGAATVVEGTGEKASEKMQSYMRGLMRATAEANGRDPRIAEAMVDESIAIEGIVEEGKLLTLSGSEAVKYGIADKELESLTEVRAYMGWSDAAKIDITETWAESFLRFLANPVVSSILMLMMLGGLYFELQTPGFGFAGTISAVGAVLFFAPLYLLGLAESWEIILFVIGVLLLIAEIFLIPGFGFLGVAGIVMIVFSLGAALVGNVGLDFPDLELLTRAIWTLAITLVLTILLISSLARYLPDNRWFNHLVLSASTDVASGYVTFAEHDDLMGSTGTALSTLRPAGTVLIDGKRYDVVSDGDFIEKGATVKVSEVVGGKIVVSRTA